MRIQEEKSGSLEDSQDAGLDAGWASDECHSSPSDVMFVDTGVSRWAFCPRLWVPGYNVRVPPT